MINTINLQDIPSILSYGFIGLGFLLALLTFIVLVKVINSPEQRNSSVFLTSVFMLFSLIMAGGGAYIELVTKNKSQDMKSLSGQLESLLKEKESLTRIAEQAQNQLHAVNKELSDIKAKPFNWTYKAAGDHFQCYVDGQKIGAKLNCKQHASCNNLQLNRAMCALRYSGQVFN